MAASLVLAGLVATVGMGTTSASAQTNDCLPPPTLIYGEIAQVAGTNSQVWTDVQQVEATDEAAGTSGSGQVIVDMLAVITRDGYQWDCATDQLEAANVGTIPVSSGLPVIPATPATIAPATTTPVTAPAATAHPGATSTTATSTTATTALPDTGLANSAPVGVTGAGSGNGETQVTTQLALTAGDTQSTTNTGDLSTVAFGLLALVTAALLVMVIRWQMGRR
jgi:hypothetical protein